MRALSTRLRQLSRRPATEAGGYSFVELLVVVSILFVLASAAMPMAQVASQRQREIELHRDLREMRTAIDKYKDYADLGYLGPQKLGTNNWPETLDVLVEARPHTDHESLRRQAEESIRETIGLTCAVTVLAPGVLPETEGRSRVTDRREN